MIGPCNANCLSVFSQSICQLKSIFTIFSCTFLLLVSSCPFYNVSLCPNLQELQQFWRIVLRSCDLNWNEFELPVYWSSNTKPYQHLATVAFCIRLESWQVFYLGPHLQKFWLSLIPCQKKHAGKKVVHQVKHNDTNSRV